MAANDSYLEAGSVPAPGRVAHFRAADSLAARTVSGAAWSTLSIVGQRGLSLLSTMVLARLLAPSAFGLLGMALVLTAAMYSFKDLGTAAALIQRKELDRQLASTLFWTNVLFGLAGAGFMVGVAPLVAKFYREPQVAHVFAALSVPFLVNSLGVAQRAVLARAMLFRRLSVIQLISSAASAAIGITLAVAGAGVWSLVAAVTSEVSTAVVLYWVASPWRPDWHLSLHDLRSVTSFSANLTGANIAGYFMRNMDNALIGRFLGASALGYYGLAYGLMMYPLYNVTWNLGNVLFPALSRIQEEDARFRQAYLRAVSVIATITFPLMLGLLATADLLVPACFGAKWAPMVPIVRVLAPVDDFHCEGTHQHTVSLGPDRSQRSVACVRNRPSLGDHWRCVRLCGCRILAVLSPLHGRRQDHRPTRCGTGVHSLAANAERCCDVCGCIANEIWAAAAGR
jgi:O-antigen/teichoic acid export membrane protein